MREGRCHASRAEIVSRKENTMNYTGILQRASITVSATFGTQEKREEIPHEQAEQPAAPDGCRACGLGQGKRI
jgi:hypothetical protein